jgi:hypothetical protein
MYLEFFESLLKGMSFAFYFADGDEKNIQNVLL